MPWLCIHRYVNPCIHIPRGPSWPIMGISFTMVFLCENVQFALMVSPRIATDVHIWLLRRNVFFAVHTNGPGQQEPQISHQLNTYGTWWSGNLLFLQSLPQTLPNYDNGCKMLVTIYTWRQILTYFFPGKRHATCPIPFQTTNILTKDFEWQVRLEQEMRSCHIYWLNLHIFSEFLSIIN